MIVTKNVLQFRNGFVNLPQDGKSENSLNLVMSVAAELMQFGFILDDNAKHQLEFTPLNELVKFHDEVISYLKDITGSTREYKPFWKGFPEEVMQQSELNLWIHQVLHYISNGTYEPNEFTKSRSTAFELPNYNIIESGDETRFQKIFTDLVSVNQSLTPVDLEIIKWFVDTKQVLVFPNSIPFKENMCTLGALKLQVPVKTVTDVLRIAIGMSGGDISMPPVPNAMIRPSTWSTLRVPNANREAFKFKKFTREDRRFLLGLLESTNCSSAEAVLKDGRWIRLGEILHPGEYKEKFPKAARMFNTIRNEKVQSWYGRLNEAFKISCDSGLDVLSERPGEFMRRLDWLIRKYPSNTNKILDVLDGILLKVSNKVLYEAYGHFESRTSNSTRFIFVKGSRNPIKLRDLQALDPILVYKIQARIKNSLSIKFGALPKLGNVWIDEKLRNIPVPTNMRTMSDSMHIVTRGSRLPFNNKDAKVIRAFVHWFDEFAYEDVDLTATLVGSSGRITHIGWNGTHVSEFGCYSGDVRHSQGACAEYIDIDIKNAKANGYKYVLLDARNYSGRPFNTLNECVFGYMEREVPTANEIFKPSTLANTCKLSSQAATILVAILDLETMEYIPVDVDSSGMPVASQNAQAILDTINLYSNPPKFSVYDLLELHANARGQISSEANATTRFEFSDFSTSYIETAKFMGT